MELIRKNPKDCWDLIEIGECNVLLKLNNDCLVTAKLEDEDGEIIIIKRDGWNQFEYSLDLTDIKEFYLIKE